MVNQKRLPGCYRISLRTAFVIMTLICLFLGINVRNAIRQKAAVEWASKNRMQVYYGNGYQFGQVARPGRKAPPAPGPAWLRKLVGVDMLASVERVTFHSVPRDGTATELGPLADMRSLRELKIERLNIDDLSTMPQITKLERLYLGYTKIEDVAPLAKLTSLKHLSLNNTRVKDVSCLASLKNLETLGLYKTHVSAADVRRLQMELPNCKISR